jgi:hypothetical protein
LWQLKAVMSVLPVDNLRGLQGNSLSLPAKTIATGAEKGRRGTAMQEAGALQQDSHDGRLGPHVSRLLHHREAAWWFGLIGAAGFAQFMGFLMITIIIYASLRGLGHDPEQMSTAPVLVSLALSVVVAIAFAIHIYRTQRATFWDPPKNPMPRRRWGSYANLAGVVFGLLVAYTTFLMWLFLLLGLIIAFSFSGLPGHPLLWLVPVPTALMLWAFVSVRHEVLEKFETAEPPQLRLAADLRQHLDAFENASEELASFSKKVQGVIEAEQKQLRKLRDQYRLHAHLMELSDRAPTLRTVIAQSGRWGLLVNVVVAAVSIVVTLLIDALVDTDALGSQLRQWFHLG